MSAELLCGLTLAGIFVWAMVWRKVFDRVEHMNDIEKAKE